MRKREKKIVGKKTNLKIIFLILILLGGLFLLFLFFKAIWGFKKSSDRLQGRVNLVVSFKNDEIYLLSIEDKSLLAVGLPKKQKVTVPYGFGEYEAGKVYGLGQLERKGGLLLRETVSSFFQVPVVGYFVDESSFEVNNFQKMFKKVIYRSLLGKNKTNFNKTDLLFLFLKGMSLDEASVKYKKFDYLSESDFKDKKLREGLLSIAIFNATETPGLAQSFAFSVEKNGGRVVRIADAPKKEKESILYLSSEFFGCYTQSWFLRWFSWKILPQSKVNSNRAEVTIVLGEDYWKKYNERW